MNTIAIFSTPRLNTRSNTSGCASYSNILTVSGNVAGPFNQFIRPVRTPALSPYKSNNGCACALAISDAIFSALPSASQAGLMCAQSNGGQASEGWLIPESLPFLINYLNMNGYHVDTTMTTMLNASELKLNTQNSNTLVFYITYNVSNF